MKNRIKIAPSILSADFSNLEREIKKLDKSSCEYIHIDVMDGHFVPNITMGPEIIRSIRGFTKKVFDVHLMIDPVEKFLKNFIDVGSDIITIHDEISDNALECIEFIKNNNKKAGISIKPKTSAKVITKYLQHIDLVLIMTVEPGFGGQSFLSNQIKKIKEVKKIVGNKKIEIEVDGGINKLNAKEVINAGANVLVSGSSIFQSSDYESVIRSLRSP